MQLQTHQGAFDMMKKIISRQAADRFKSSVMKITGIGWLRIILGELLKQWFLPGKVRHSGGANKFSGGCESLRALQEGKFLKWKVYRPIYSLKSRGLKQRTIT